MVNTCATCKHWKKSFYGGTDHGKCDQIAHGTCDDAAYTGLYEGCDDFRSDRVPLRTRPDFGCTLWQARDGVLGNMMTDGRNSWPKEGEK